MPNILLITSNPKKYKGMEPLLHSLNIKIRPPLAPIIEPQGMSLKEVAETKVTCAFEQFSQPVLIDEAGLSLDAFPGFPGPMTRFALKTLGKEGLEKLIAENSRAEMSCALAYTNGIEIMICEGASAGYLDLDIPVDPKGPGPFASWFISDDGYLAHRQRALLRFENYRKKNNECAKQS